MFKKGQLVRGKVSGRHYRVLYGHEVRLLVEDVRSYHVGWIGVPFVELIGNNYTAKDSKESAPGS
ncbi:hypothetical protein [Salmonella phage SETP13]|uniref:Uncharacterized protein n=1 Tax=Salmonella phage SETP13 TaxID=424949 RepID=U5N104_9CAUD|nr:hypothetical protein V186_gp50 [Salmonella phage SETP13]AGX84654.1 hypothetical protein [Salmonella phage SETP13]